ncbi:MAG: bifunctional phosphoribosyl-AMP cyclohydrolase/phosphoribosyl-ATP diphosphatase HisIE [Acidimicrobiia bacterium]|jgi:phosphoribosyl-ATP pyrophosphohydrolase/phosphoribosyl-AMP cyclohydrolase
MTDIAFDEQGLVPGIVQDATTGRVLMLGYLNAESLERTRATGLVHFWSRSRQELWRKGETSGNLLELVDIAIDCDGDALLIRAEPTGPTCHTGAASCFDAAMLVADRDASDTGGRASRFGFLDELWAVIEERNRTRPDGSYTAHLLAGGVDATARKVTEEATEVLLAAKDHAMGGRADLVAEEAADLMYHLLVLLAERGVDPADVVEVLRRRAG